MGKLRQKSRNGIYRDYYNLQRGKGGMIIFKKRIPNQSGGRFGGNFFRMAFNFLRKDGVLDNVRKTYKKTKNDEYPFAII